MIPVCGTCHTQGGFYKALWEDALRPRRPDAIVTSSLFAGFSYADIPPMGFAVLVYTNDDAPAARLEASRLSRRAWEGREAFRYTPTGVEEAVRKARPRRGKPVVIADMSDNPGGGGSNDGVTLVAELLKQGVPSAAVGTVYDPGVVAEAERAGIGGRVRTMLGAKTDGFHGPPLAIDGRVRLIYDGTFQYRGPMSKGAWGSIGKTAVIDLTGTADRPGVEVMVCSKRAQTRDPEVFRSAGIDPMDKEILVVKSAVHFRAAFEPLAAEVVVADGPGLTSLDLSLFEFKRIRRPLWPIDP
jgi:microcystin degradation protein MlrC